MTEVYLQHHGILGQKWGVRRFQNEDGTLTEAGKKKYSKQYKKLSVKAQTEINRNYQSRMNKATEQAAEELNNGLIEKFNADYEKKLGKKANDHYYKMDPEYYESYDVMVNDLITNRYNKLTVQEIANNKNYKKAKALCEKYSLDSFDQLAKTNTEDEKRFTKEFG